MNLRAMAILVGLVLVALFAMLNWAAFSAPTVLSLGFTEVSAPLGIVMLAVTALVIVLFLVYLVFQQAGVILETRRAAKDLKAQRELADKSEASRFAELRSFFDAELRRIEAQSAAATREVGERIAQLDRQLLDKLDESTRTLSGYVGEVEDKLDRLLPRSP